MAKKTPRNNPFAFTPIVLDQESHEKRRVIKQLPVVHQTETLQKFFGASADHLFDPGKGKPINGYVGQKPLWYDPDQDYYLEEGTQDRNFYQLEASMVSKNPEGQLTDLLPYPDLINQLRFQGALTNNHNRLFSQDFYTWCPPIDLDKIVNFRQYVWLPIDDVAPTSTFDVDNEGWLLNDGTPAPTSGPFSGLSRYLGGFAGTPTGEQVVSRQFTLNSNNTTAALQFDFLKMNSWDGIPGVHVAPQANGPETLSVYLNDQLAFSFTPVGIDGQGGASIGSGTIDLGDIQGTYNVTSPGADSQLDADHVGNDPNDPWSGAGATFLDRVYRIVINLTGTGKTLKMGFGSNTDEPLLNESLGIDNVSVRQSGTATSSVIVKGPTRNLISAGDTKTYDLPGYGANDDVKLKSFYDLGVLSTGLISAYVDGEAKTFSYTPGQTTITFDQRPAADAEISISVYSDLENNAVGSPHADPLAFGGVTLSSGMRVIVNNDKNTDYKKTDVFIVEGVGQSIFLLNENDYNAGAVTDYMVMARGAADRNEWSTRNRWFHVSTLPEGMDADYVLQHRATRPIVEFNRNLELYNYGLSRRLDVDLVVENIEDLNGYLNQNPQRITLNGILIACVGTNQINVSAVNPNTNTIYGDVSSIRVLVRNTINPLLNNNVLVLVNQGNVLKLILETDGSNPSGEPVYGEVVKVLLGTYAGKNLHWDGSNWVVGQHKAKANQAPLFELYDLNGSSLRDPGLYPNSTFKGSKVFSYKQDTTGTRAADPVLGLSLVHDNKGQILFENYLSTETYQYVVGGKFFDITGFYFHNTTDEDASKDQLSNDWFKAPNQTRQFMIDRYVSDGRTKLFNVSQNAAEISVTRGRVNDSKSFERSDLVEDRDFIRVGRQVMILNIQNGDIIEIRTFSPSNPPEDATGHYEVPLNLQANPDNSEVVSMTKGDFYDHFSEIMKKQDGFTGAEYSDNNYRDTAKLPNLGTHVIQHSAGLLKTMLLASQAQLDMMTALRFVDSEYARFKDKFQQKILSYTFSNQLANATSYDVWINTALTDLNKGKTKHFPFYLSGMAQNEANRLPTFIPPTPSFVGVYPLFAPEIISQGVVGADDVWFVRGHDGSLTQGQNETVARVMLALEQRIFDSVPASIRNRERPLSDFQVAYGDEFRVNDYSYDEYLQILRPSFERWTVAYRQDSRVNDLADNSVESNINLKANPWMWNWSSTKTTGGDKVPGHWRGIYEKFFGTQRPDLTPWESLGFAIKPDWWDDRYGQAPYTSENLVLWDDLEQGYIHDGERKGINEAWARPGLSQYMPVDLRGRLRHPGPRNLIAYDVVTADTDLSYATDADQWEDLHDEGVLGCGICTTVPLVQERRAEWNWGDLGPVEQTWRRSSAFAFAAAGAGYLMKPAQFVELGWNTQDLSLFFKGERNEQFLNQDTKGRPRHGKLRVHGEVLEDLTLVTKVGIQQWISDLLASKNTEINSNFADRVRGLGSQLSYKVAGFTDSTTLVVVSDAFGRVPSEDVTVALYRSPSVREETYSGVAIEYTGRGYEVFGYDSLNPYFSTLPPAVNSGKISVGDGAKSAAIPTWKASTYFGVGITVKYQDNFYRALKTHTSSTFFEEEFWTQVARPQYADGTALMWYSEGELVQHVEKVAYGTVFKEPQEVADFLNGYERYLKNRGWIFEDVGEDEQEVRDWKSGLKSFITWSNAAVRQAGDYLAISPSSKLIQFATDQGTIQPIEQIINGLYAIVDQQGQPIDSQITRVVRNDGNISVSCNDNRSGIFGLRLYVSELEHVLVFNNTTIFGDTLYSPLLNIKQPRLRLQGFKTVDWKGRIDAPGFIVTGDKLTPNFERAADDFRRFFDIESMENKKLQDRARANFGYEEKEYLNNLLLTPTNQFEFYQGMIQQKGSTTSMRRLLRSNFIRHNKGLKLFEEWAFRVGDYGGQEVSPQLDIQILQSEFKHNPQMVQFSTVATPNTFGIIDVVDTNVGQDNRVLDARWHWRPDMKAITWPLADFGQGDAPMPTAGFVNLDEVRFTVATNEEFTDFFGKQEETDERIEAGDRVWVYGVGSGDPKTSWMTHKFNDTTYDVLNTFIPTHDAQGTVVQLNRNLNGYASETTDPLTEATVFVSQPLVDGVDDNGIPVSGEKLILKDLLNSDLNLRTTFIPKPINRAKTSLGSASGETFIMGMFPEATQMIRAIRIIVDEAYEAGSELRIGHAGNLGLFVNTQVNVLGSDDSRDIFPGQNEPEAVKVLTPATSYVPPSVSTADVELIRVGRQVNFCAETIVEWTYVRARDQAVFTGDLTYIRPSDYLNSDDASLAYQQTIQLPLMAEGEPAGSEGTLILKTNGVETDRQYVKFVRSTSAGYNFVDLTRTGSYEFSRAKGFNLFPWNTNLAGTYRELLASLISTGSKGALRIEVDYHYLKGFELTENVNGTVEPVLTAQPGATAQIFTWIKTRYPTKASIPAIGSTWNNGDIVEVDSGEEPGLWSTYKMVGGGFTEVRRQNRKVNSDLITNAAIFNSQENKLKLILQLYDPYKGFIPGSADRELTYKTFVDPAVYNDGLMVWGKEQVNQLWWDLSTVRYLDYEIYDKWNGTDHEGVTYRWKNWGRVAPNSNVDVYQWIKSPVAPSGWNAYVESKSNLKVDNKPSGTVLEMSNFVTDVEWNDNTQSDEMVYYFWVKNPTVVPTISSRKLSAKQVSNIITNPTANDIPFFAVIDTNKCIVGGIKQFLNETDTVLKVKWLQEAEIHNNHHKQWMILREEDERNTINDDLWNKMRDSLVGWDATQKPVPDALLPTAQQIGSAVRPRQSWYPADASPNGGQRPSRGARAAFVDSMNDMLSEQPFVDLWYDADLVFNTGDNLPAPGRYVTTALDLADLRNLLPATRNMVQVGECVLIENTTEVAGFWTLWKLVEINGARTFILEDFQKWRMQEGELWNLADWYADGWSAKNFPNYRFANYAARDAAGNLDVTLLKGTLVQIDQQSPTDDRWSWDVYTSTTKYQVAKARSTMKLSDAFYDDSRVEFGPKQVNAILGTSDATRITPDRIQELADIVNYRDGSSEIEFMLNILKVKLLDTLQKNQLFFGMVKSAFKQSMVVDWAFKTSFLYLGGYSETLRQNPVAFKDQIDNVIAYLEEVKPYHVKIREYVRRLSYGPDLANLAITDFDKPVYPDGKSNRVLDVNSESDQAIMGVNRPWKDWYENYQNQNRNLDKWDRDWNGVRRMNIKIKFDRISCGTVRGWDTSPWDPALLVYSQLGGTTRSLSQLNALYRNRPTDGSIDFYKDQTVETIEERNYLVRKNIVTPDRPGTIVSVLQTGEHFMWSGNDWIKFEAIGWDQDPDMGTATRVEAAYRPQAGMKRKDDAGVIAGCEFDGTVITDSFVEDGWDIFEWDSTGYSQGLRDRAGMDQDAIDGNSKDAVDRGPEQETDIPTGTTVTDFKLRSAGFKAASQFSGVVGFTATHRSYGVYTFSTTNTLLDFQAFDVFGGGEIGGTAADMSAYLNAIPDGTTVIVTSHDEPQVNHLTSGLDVAMARVGAGSLFLTDGFIKYRSAYILIGKAGVGENGGREFYKGSVGDSPENFVDINIRMVDGVPYLLTSQSTGSESDSDIKITGNQFSQAAINGNRPHELVSIRGVESLVINVKKASGLYQKNFMNHKGLWQDMLVSGQALTFVDWDQNAHKLVVSTPSWGEDARGFTPLHDPQNPSTGFIRDIMVSKGYRSTSSVDMTAPGVKTFKLRDANAVDGIPAGVRGNGVRVAVINTKDLSKRSLGTITASRGSESSWDGNLTITFDADGFQAIGSGKNWNIIPVEMFNQPGIVWVGNARFTYNTMTHNGNNVILNGAYLSGSTLAPLTITDTTATLTETGPVVDGSIVRWMSANHSDAVPHGANIKRPQVTTDLTPFPGSPGPIKP